MKLILGVFSGANLQGHPKLIPDTAGVDSRNQKPGRGDLRPWNSPNTAAVIPAGRQTIYRMGRDVRSDANYWLSWATRVHVIRGYDAEDTTERTYFTGSGTPKWIDNTFALAGGGPWPAATRELGIPKPTTQLVVNSVNDGTSTTETARYYTYTYVNSKGDESAPAPPSALLTCKIDDTASLTGITPPPGGYDVNRIRVYVTESGVTGATEYFFLRELVYTAGSTTDDLRPRGEVLATDGWLPPPANSKCLTRMWNGMAALISGNGVRVCPPYAMYAWPLAFEHVPPDCTPVGLGTWGQHLLVLTTGRPAVIVGTSPDAMDLQPVNGPSCSSEPSIVSFDHGVVYAGEDGLAYYGDNGPKILTEGLIEPTQWKALNPSTMVASQFLGMYLCFYTVLGAPYGFLIDPRNPQGIFFLDQGYAAPWFDELQQALFVLEGNAVKKWDADAATPMTARYRSKLWETGTVNFAWARVQADAYPVTFMLDAGPFTTGELAELVDTFPSELSAVGSYLRATHTVADAKPFRLHAGFKAKEWQAEVQTTQPVQALVLATTANETR